VINYTKERGNRAAEYFHLPPTEKIIHEWSTQEEDLDNADKSKYCFKDLAAKLLELEKVKNLVTGHSNEDASYTAENTSFTQY
jgi:hypothetical protein